MKRKSSFFSARNITYFSILLAIVIVLQLFFGTVKIGATSFSLVLIPIVLGAVLIGPLAGALLGLAFGIITLVYGIVGTDPFTAILFMEHPILTSLTCLVKGTAAGLLSGLVYKAIAKRKKKSYSEIKEEDEAAEQLSGIVYKSIPKRKKKSFSEIKEKDEKGKNYNNLIAVIVASATAPIVNTGLFIIGALFMSDTLSANFIANGSTVIYFLVIGCAGINFLVEFFVNLVVSPSLARVVNVVEKKFY